MPQYFSVKDFEKFQHYKDRNPPWIKFYNTTLDDYDLGKLPDAAKAHLFAIWLLASRNNNQIPYDPTWVANKINATSPVDLELLSKTGFIILEQACSKTLSLGLQDACLEERRGEERQSQFSEWYKLYPNKKGNGAAEKAYNKVIKNKNATHEELVIGLNRFLEDIKIKKTEKQFIAHPATWLNQGRWEDEYETKKREPLF